MSSIGLGFAITEPNMISEEVSDSQESLEILTPKPCQGLQTDDKSPRSASVEKEIEKMLHGWDATPAAISTTSERLSHLDEHISGKDTDWITSGVENAENDSRTGSQHQGGYDNEGSKSLSRSWSSTFDPDPTTISNSQFLVCSRISSTNTSLTTPTGKAKQEGIFYSDSTGLVSAECSSSQKPTDLFSSNEKYLLTSTPKNTKEAPFSTPTCKLQTLHRSQSRLNDSQIVNLIEERDALLHSKINSVIAKVDKLRAFAEEKFQLIQLDVTSIESLMNEVSSTMRKESDLSEKRRLDLKRDLENLSKDIANIPSCLPSAKALSTMGISNPQNDSILSALQQLEFQLMARPCVAPQSILPQESDRPFCSDAASIKGGLPGKFPNQVAKETAELVSSTMEKFLLPPIVKLLQHFESSRRSSDTPSSDSELIPSNWNNEGTVGRRTSFRTKPPSPRSSISSPLSCNDHQLLVPTEVQESLVQRLQTLEVKQNGEDALGNLCFHKDSNLYAKPEVEDNRKGRGKRAKRIPAKFVDAVLEMSHLDSRFSGLQSGVACSTSDGAGRIPTIKRNIGVLSNTKIKRRRCSRFSSEEKAEKINQNASYDVDGPGSSPTLTPASTHEDDRSKELMPNLQPKPKPEVLPARDTKRSEGLSGRKKSTNSKVTNPKTVARVLDGSSVKSLKQYRNFPESKGSLPPTVQSESASKLKIPAHNGTFRCRHNSESLLPCNYTTNFWSEFSAHLLETTHGSRQSLSDTGLTTSDQTTKIKRQSGRLMSKKCSKAAGLSGFQRSLGSKSKPILSKLPHGIWKHIDDVELQNFKCFPCGGDFNDEDSFWSHLVSNTNCRENKSIRDPELSCSAFTTQREGNSETDQPKTASPLPLSPIITPRIKPMLSTVQGKYNCELCKLYFHKEDRFISHLRYECKPGPTKR